MSQSHYSPKAVAIGNHAVQERNNTSVAMVIAVDRLGVRQLAVLASP